MKKTRYHVIPILGITEGQKIPNIAYKLPANVREVKGFRAIANEYSVADNNYNLGYLSLHFDNKEKHVIYDTVQSKPLEEVNGKLSFVPLEEPVRGGTFVQGFFLDHGYALFYPYDLRIYLECEIEIDE
jgi:hypothetical protein